VADTVWAAGFWAADFWAADFWSSGAAAAVPDVVGQTQADGTLALENDGFVVAAVTAASSTVAAGLIISQDPVAGSSAAPGSTVTITVSTGDTGVLDVKFSARRPNVVMKRLSELEPKKPIPAEITNMPDAPEPPPPVAGALARGLDLSELPPDPPAAEPVPEEPQAEVAQRQSAAEAPASAEGAGSTPALGATPDTAAAPTPSPAVTHADLAAETLRVTESVAKAISSVGQAVDSSMTGQMDGLVEVLRAIQTELSGLRTDWAEERKAQALRERNRQRAEEIAQRLLKSD
jgi:hypothetical protein